jgi:chlorophyll synthase
MQAPALKTVAELLKPITWFAPMWALGCGVVSSGASIFQHGPTIIAGILLAGPLVCGTSQAANDWFDRHVDAINEPNRPIPSGRMPGRWGLYIAIIWTILSLAVSTILGPWGIGAAILGLILAWAYSAPPFRLKLNGWWGNSAVALCYEGLPWVTGAIVMGVRMPNWQIITLALLYSLGAHGIMTLNDFKSVEGDIRMGVNSLPVMLGVEGAASLACLVMGLPQIIVIGLMFLWGHPLSGALIAIVLLIQARLMTRLVEAPQANAPWYNATGTTLYVSGMLISAIALGSSQVVPS